MIREAVLQRAKTLCAEVEKSLKVRYSKVGIGSVDRAVLLAAFRAKALFCSWTGPGLGAIEIKWMREESFEEHEYYQRFPQDRDDPIAGREILTERDSPINGFAGGVGDDSIYICADLNVGQVVNTVAHELQHKRQPFGMSPEDREREAHQVAANFCQKFFPQSERRAWTLQELVYLAKGGSL